MCLPGRKVLSRRECERPDRAGGRRARTERDRPAIVISGLLSRALRGAPPRRDLVAPGSVPRLLTGIAACAAVLPGVALATGLSLKAAGVPYPGTIASAAAMTVSVAGGQMLIRYHTAFLVRRSGGRG